MELPQVSSQKWYDRRMGALLVSIVALASAYLAGSRAIFTGSLQQYTLAFLAFILCINRFFRAVWPPRAVDSARAAKSSKQGRSLK